MRHTDGQSFSRITDRSAYSTAEQLHGVIAGDIEFIDREAASEFGRQRPAALGSSVPGTMTSFAVSRRARLLSGMK